MHEYEIPKAIKVTNNCLPQRKKSSFWKVPIVNADFAKHKFRFFLSLVLVLKLLFCALLSQIWQCRVLHTLSKSFCMENLAVLSDSAHHYDHHHSRHHHHHHDGHFNQHHQKWGTPRSTCITQKRKVESNAVLQNETQWGLYAKVTTDRFTVVT